MNGVRLEVSVDTERDTEVAVSAAALYLLRTLTKEHTKESRVANSSFRVAGSSFTSTARLT